MRIEVETALKAIVPSGQCEARPVELPSLDRYSNSPGVKRERPPQVSRIHRPGDVQELRRIELVAALEKLKSVAPDPCQVVAFVKSVEGFAKDDSRFVLIRAAEFVDAGHNNLTEILELTRIAYQLQGSFGLVRETVADLKRQAKWDPFSYIPFLHEIAQSRYPIDKLMVLGHFMRAGIYSPADLKDLFKNIDSLGADEAKIFFNTLPDLLSGLKARTPKEIERLKINLNFVVSYGPGHFQDLKKVMGGLKINLSHLDSSTIGSELGRRWTRMVARSDQPPPADVATSLARLVSHLQGTQISRQGTFGIRFSFSAELSPRSAYLLIVQGGDQLDPSFLTKIWRDQNVQDIGRWLHQVDSQEVYVQTFIVNLCARGLSNLMRPNLSYFLKKVETLLRNSDSHDEVLQRGRVFIPFFDQALPLVSESERRAFAQFLHQEYQRRESHLISRQVIAYLISLYSEKFHLDRYVTELKEIAKNVASVAYRKIPRDQWIKDGTMTAKLYFYERDWFIYTMNLLIGSLGWKEDLEYKRKEGFGDKYRVVTKTVNGIRLRVVLAHTRTDEDDRLKSLNSGRYAIIGHRGHSGTDQETFPLGDEPVTAKGVLLLDGGCNTESYMMAPAFIEKYGDNFFVADSTRGYGEVTTNFVDQLMTGVARGETTWNFLRHFERNTEEMGLWLPDHPSFVIDFQVASPHNDNAAPPSDR